MKDVDLPDPTRPTHVSATDAENHDWRLLVTATAFVTAYSMVHRLVMPGITRLSPIDWGFVPAFALTLWLYRQSSVAKVGSLLAGSLLALAVIETSQVSHGTLRGWFAISHMISAWPLALISFRLLQFSTRKPNWGIALIGAAALAACSQTLAIWHPHTEPQVVAKKIIVPAPIPMNLSCGTLNLSVTPQTPLTESFEVILEECGFANHSLLRAHGPLKLINRTSRAENFHALIRHKDGLLQRWNRLVPAGQSADSPQFDLGPDEALLLYSDSRASAGLVAVLPHSRHHTVAFERNPPHIDITIQEGQP